MVALLVRLKLTLLKNSLSRSVWRTVGLVLGLAYALGITVLAVAGLVGLRFTSVELTADVTVLAFAALTVGWPGMSLLVFGVDETVDPAKFALLPVRARELLPGLLIAGLVGGPGLATVVVAAGLVACWARTGPLTVAAAVAAPLGVVTCFLCSRAATATFASALSSRRFRDFAFVVLALFAVGLGLGGNLIGGLVSNDPAQMRALLAAAAVAAGWSPFGWAWAVPADAARGQWLLAAVHLLLAIGLIVALGRIWERALAARLTSPIEGGSRGGQVRKGTAVDRLFPPTPAGGVAARTFRYWRRDPRYLVGVAAIVIAPIVLMVSAAVSPEAPPLLAAFAPALLSMVLGMSLAQDLSYDGTALWQHLATGLRGRDDRLGRIWSTAVIFGPVLAVLVVAGLAIEGRWDVLPQVLAVTIGIGAIGLGVGTLVGTLWQWPAPPPGANPFQKGSSGGLPGFLSFLVTTIGTLVGSLPVLALVIGSIWSPWLGWIALPVSLGLGALALRIGVSTGGQRLDRRWPEVLVAVSERSG